MELLFKPTIYRIPVVLKCIHEKNIKAIINAEYRAQNSINVTQRRGLSQFSKISALLLFPNLGNEITLRVAYCKSAEI